MEKKHFRSRSNVDLLHELDLAGLACFTSWLKHRLRHSISEEGEKTCFDYYEFHTFVTCMLRLSEKCHFTAVSVMAMALELTSWSIFVE